LVPYDLNCVGAHHKTKLNKQADIATDITALIHAAGFVFLWNDELTKVN
jgi:hypothetical protein